MDKMKDKAAKFKFKQKWRGSRNEKAVPVGETSGTSYIILDYVFGAVNGVIRSVWRGWEGQKQWSLRFDISGALEES